MNIRPLHPLLEALPSRTKHELVLYTVEVWAVACVEERNAIVALIESYAASTERHAPNSEPPRAFRALAKVIYEHGLPGVTYPGPKGTGSGLDRKGKTGSKKQGARRAGGAAPSGPSRSVKEKRGLALTEVFGEDLAHVTAEELVAGLFNPGGRA